MNIEAAAQEAIDSFGNAAYDEAAFGDAVFDDDIFESTDLEDVDFGFDHPETVAVGYGAVGRAAVDYAASDNADDALYVDTDLEDICGVVAITNALPLSLGPDIITQNTITQASTIDPRILSGGSTSFGNFTDPASDFTGDVAGNFASGSNNNTDTSLWTMPNIADMENVGPVPLFPRPLTIKELHRAAKRFNWNPSAPLYVWCATLTIMEHNARLAYLDMDIQTAFILITRFMMLTARLWKQSESHTPWGKAMVTPYVLRLAHAKRMCDFALDALIVRFHHWRVDNGLPAIWDGRLEAAPCTCGKAAKLEWCNCAIDDPWFTEPMTNVFPNNLVAVSSDSAGEYGDYTLHTPAEFEDCPNPPQCPLRRVRKGKRPAATGDNWIPGTPQPAETDPVVDGGRSTSHLDEANVAVGDSIVVGDASDLVEDNSVVGTPLPDRADLVIGGTPGAKPVDKATIVVVSAPSTPQPDEVIVAVGDTPGTPHHDKAANVVAGDAPGAQHPNGAAFVAGHTSGEPQPNKNDLVVGHMELNAPPTAIVFAPRPKKGIYTLRPVAYREDGKPLRAMFIPHLMQKRFLRRVQNSTKRGIETYGVLYGKLRANNQLCVTHLVIPKQSGTLDTCETTDDANTAGFIAGNDLLQMGWIHTHPTQKCFMSSRDLHTHVGFQRLLDESVAIVCSPTDKTKAGIFRIPHEGLAELEQCPMGSLTVHDHPERLSVDARHPRGPVFTVPVNHFKVVDLRQPDDRGNAPASKPFKKRKRVEPAPDEPAPGEQTPGDQVLGKK